MRRAASYIYDCSSDVHVSSLSTPVTNSARSGPIQSPLQASRDCMVTCIALVHLLQQMELRHWKTLQQTSLIVQHDCMLYCTFKAPCMYKMIQSVYVLYIHHSYDPIT